MAWRVARRPGQVRRGASAVRAVSCDRAGHLRRANRGKAAGAHGQREGGTRRVGRRAAISRSVSRARGSVERRARGGVRAEQPWRAAESSGPTCRGAAALRARRARCDCCPQPIRRVARLVRERTLRHQLNAKALRLSRTPQDAAHEKELTALNAEVDGLTVEYRDLEGQIRASSPAYAALTQPQAVTLHEVQQLVSDGDS